MRRNVGRGTMDDSFRGLSMSWWCVWCSNMLLKGMTFPFYIIHNDVDQYSVKRVNNYNPLICTI